jgi:hypothetical protein
MEFVFFYETQITLCTKISVQEHEVGGVMPTAVAVV